MKQFFSVDFHDYYYDIGESMNIGKDELDRTYNVLNRVFAKGFEGEKVPSFSPL